MQALLSPLAEGMSHNAAQLTSDRAQAMYVIAGTPNDTGISYAWFKRSDVDAEVQTPKEIAPGCSPNSPYPLRTDWAIPEPEKKVSLESTLSDSAVQLARLNGWLHLESSRTGQEDFPYRLALRLEFGEEYVSEGGKTYKNGKYELWLLRNRMGTALPRWVYVLGIDCEGKGTLMWPYDGGPPAGKFPAADNGGLNQMLLPGEPIAVDDPLGRHLCAVNHICAPVRRIGSRIQGCGDAEGKVCNLTRSPRRSARLYQRRHSRWHPTYADQLERPGNPDTKLGGAASDARKRQAAMKATTHLLVLTVTQGLAQRYPVRKLHLLLT